jgi:peroxiredoxin
MYMKKSPLTLRTAVFALRTAALVLAAAPSGLFAQTAAPSSALAQAATTFRITGQLKNVQAEWIYLVYVNEGRQILDSTKVNNGAYVFSGDLSQDGLAALLDVRPTMGSRPSAASMARIYLTPESFTVTHIDSFSNTTVTGSLANTEFKKIQDQVKPYNDKEMALMPQYQAARASGDEAAGKAVEEQVKSIEGEMGDKVYGPYVRNNPNSPLALYALQLYAASDLDAQKLQPLFDGLSSSTKTSKAGAAFQQRLTITAKTAIGKTAMDFTQNDTLGKAVTLSSFRGKYVLLDFWASWCGPCRAENPNVVKAYAKYHAKGFDILSVSLDKPDDKEKWLKAIHADQLTWTHVSDLQFWNNAVAKEYGINSIPQNFLIDPQGKIIGKGLRGDELEKKLTEIYKD